MRTRKVFTNRDPSAKVRATTENVAASSSGSSVYTDRQTRRYNECLEAVDPSITAGRMLVKLPFRLNLVVVFLLRIGAVAVVVTLALQWLIVRHYRDVVRDEAAVALQEIVDDYSAHHDPLSRPDGDLRRRVQEDLTERFSRGNMWLVQAFDEQRRPVLDLQKSDPSIQRELAEIRQDRFDDFPAPAEERFDYHMSRDDVPLLVVSASLIAGDRQLGTLRAVLAIDPAIVREARGDLHVARIATLVTLGAFLLAIFPLIIDAYRRLNRKRLALLRSNLRTIVALTNAVAIRDSDTEEHNYRVTLYAIALAEEIGCDKDLIRSLIKGAILHDVGKIGIRDAVLLKPGRLDADEFAIMQTHVDLGAEIVEDVEWLRDSREVILHHHEKFDGSGYEQGLRQYAIPLPARIFAVVDVFDALASRRPYKEAMPLAEVCKILEEGRGQHFDPEVLDVFLKLAPQLHALVDHLPREQLERLLSAQVEQYFGIPL